MARQLTVMLIIIALAGCQKKGPSSQPAPKPKTTKQNSVKTPTGKSRTPGTQPKGYLDKVAGVGIVQLRADGFTKLPLKQKLLAYYLVRAAEAGHEIIYDHNHRWSLQIRDILQAIWLHPKGIDAGVLKKIRHYTKLFWLNGGPYHYRNKTKNKVPFTRQELEAAVARAIKNGATINKGTLKRVARLLFEPTFEALKKNSNPPKGQDIITASGMNYYSGVTMADLKGFKGKYPLNSKIVKLDGKLLEQVFRAGNPKQKIAPGLYAKQLKRVVHYLRKALPHAGKQQQKTLTELISHLESGDNLAFDRMNIAWLKDSPRVDLILGFIEQYIDPRGIKGAFEGIISFVDPKQTRLMQTVAKNAQYFENKSPWLDAYKRKSISIPVANAIHVLVGTGDAGPFLPAGINLPNSNVIRAKHGSKSVLLTNVNQGISKVTLGMGLREFALKKDRGDFRKYSATCWDALVALHEVVGHGSGKTTPKVGGKPAKFIKEYYSSLEEARADLVALHHFFDPKVIEIGLLPNKRVAEVCYRLYVQSELLMYRRFAGLKTVQDDHMRAHHMIVQYVKVKHGAVKLIKKDGKSYLVVADAKKMKQGVSELLAEIMRIKAEGDYDGAKKLFTTYGITFDHALRDEIVKRAKKIGMANFHAFVNPQFELVKSADGTISDVKIVYKETFPQQMLRYSGINSK